MDAERYNAARRLFHQAADLPANQRVSYVREHAADESMCRYVLELLAAAEGEDTDLLRPQLGRVEHTAPDSIGPYRLLSLLGRGGMGEVYLAERTDGAYSQQVALKLLSAEWAEDPAAAARFDRERQILANLSHPHIARLLDGGTTVDGRPWLAMENVVGARLDEWCLKATLEERIHLFLRIAGAVDYAHRNLVVHRDLKPANILIDAQGEPRLLDFGIAKLLEPGAGDLTLTQGAGPLTPRYASPEQVRGEPVSTASDVYTLGVLLCQMLTGRTPYRVDDSDSYGLVRAICDEEPTAPSQLGPDAPEGGPVIAQLRGDLDAIVLKALRKNPADRYASVAALVQDIENYQQSRPVTARRGSGWYRARKFMSRNRLELASGALLVALAVGFMFSLSIQLQRVESERLRAEEALGFVVDVFESADPVNARGEPLSAREMLDRGRERLAEQGRGMTSPQLAWTLGRVYASFSDYAEAEKLFRLGLAHEPAPPMRGRLLTELGRALLYQRRTDEAAPVLANALDLHAAVLGRDSLEYLQTLSLTASEAGLAGRRQEAVERHGRSIELALTMLGWPSPDQPVSGAEDPRVVRALAVELLQLGNHLAIYEANPAAITYYPQAYALMQAVLPEHDPLLGRTLNAWGVALRTARQHDAAEARLREALALQRRVLGEDHADTAMTLTNLGALLQDRGRLDAAAEAYEQAAVALERRLGPAHPTALIARHNHANTLLHSGAVAEALVRHREVLAGRQSILPDNDPDLVSSFEMVGHCLRRLGQLSEAQEVLAEGRRLAMAGLNPGHRSRIRIGLEMARALLDAGDPDQALALVQVAEEALVDERWPELQAAARFERARVLLALGDQEAALADASVALEQALAVGVNEDVSATAIEDWLAQHRP